MTGALRIALALAVLLAVSRPSFAQSADSAERGAARSLGYEGIQAYQAGDIPTAVDRLERAYQVLRVPSLALWSARALEKSGKWVEASERYLEATRLPSEDASEKSVQEQAQADARAAEAELRPKIPLLVIEVRGAPAGEVQVSRNGTPVNRALLGSGLPTNPGDVLVEAVTPQQRVEVRVVAVEGQRTPVILDFGAAGLAAPAVVPAAAVPAVVATTSTPPPSAPAKDSGAAASNGRTQRLLGWILVGTGGAALILGGVTGGMALGEKGELDAVCPQPDQCPPGTDVGLVNTLRILSTVSLIGGVVLGGAGTTLLLTAPKSKNVAVRARLGIAAIELEGTF